MVRGRAQASPNASKPQRTRDNGSEGQKEGAHPGALGPPLVVVFSFPRSPRELHIPHPDAARRTC